LFVINGEGIDLEKYQVSTIPPLDKKIVLFIGRMIKDKGIQEYIDASKNLPNIEFQALGAFEGESFDLSSIKYLGKTNDKGKPATGKPGVSLGFMGFT
jgi:glycosyltransferase involved in cell wall biosynthesis